MHYPNYQTDVLLSKGMVVSVSSLNKGKAQSLNIIVYHWNCHWDWTAAGFEASLNQHHLVGINTAS